VNITIQSVAELGLAIRAVRRSSAVRLDDLAAVAGVSKQFVGDVEYGKPTVQLGLVLKLLAELGMPLQLDIPNDAHAEFLALQLQGGPRRSPGNQRAPAADRAVKAKGAVDAQP
jgi:transcriptional regulator with XRE-family HTH domain